MREQRCLFAMSTCRLSRCLYTQIRAVYGIRRYSGLLRHVSVRAGALTRHSRRVDVTIRHVVAHDSAARIATRN